MAHFKHTTGGVCRGGPWKHNSIWLDAEEIKTAYGLKQITSEDLLLSSI